MTSQAVTSQPAVKSPQPPSPKGVKVKFDCSDQFGIFILKDGFDVEATWKKWKETLHFLDNKDVVWPRDFLIEMVNTHKNVVSETFGTEITLTRD